jgi:hypothetical protein
MNGLTSSRMLMESLAHLKNINEIPGVFVATSEEDFKRQLSKLIDSDTRIQLSEKLDYFVKFSKTSFANNLISAISTVINEKERSTIKQS